ncbi:CPCC family cysteine-rich protein [Micromonospora sp. 050-3]|uniref:CPCC family cysteine-rich protein n=1 Tax=Micromonospora sp. 050-3 TaxID=2789265 RepID=UPI0039796152
MEPAYPCVCCGYRTLSEPPGSHEICPVCGWEDDVYQLRWPYQAVGANDRSLFDAQRSFTPPASSPDSSRTQTRADVADFEPDPLWRRIDDRRDRFEPRGGSLAPWPDDRTILYWWRRRTARAWWEDVTPSALTYGDDADSRVTEFVAAVRAVADATPPADPDNLSGMEVDFDHYLWRCRSIRQVTVSSSADPARQLTAHCLAEQAASPQQVAAELEEVWMRDLRYQDWDAHLLQVTPTSVDLHVATRNSQGGYYITASIFTRWSDNVAAPTDAAPEFRTWRSG